MRQYTILRLLLLVFLLYVAWPLIPEATGRLELTFWAVWLSFVLMSLGGNLATLLQLSEPPMMEQTQMIKEKLKQRG